MNKRLAKPHEKNERMERPCGLLGVPPDKAIVFVMDRNLVRKLLQDVIWPDDRMNLRQ